MYFILFLKNLNFLNFKRKKSEKSRTLRGTKMMKLFMQLCFFFLRLGCGDANLMQEPALISPPASVGSVEEGADAAFPGTLQIHDGGGRGSRGG